MEKLTASNRISNALTKMEIYSFHDVLYHLPRTYDNFAPTKLTGLNDKDRVVFLGRLTGAVSYTKKGRLSIVRWQMETKDGTFFRLVAFNRPYLLKFINSQNLYTVVGKYDALRREINLQTIVKGEMHASEYLRPIYSLPTDLANHEFVRLVNKAFTNMHGTLDNFLPANLIKKYRFIDEETALKQIHFPKDETEIYQGLRVLKYQESLIYALQTLLIREENKALPKGSKSPIELKNVNDFIKSLPYKLTRSQVNAIREIILDMNEKELMYRLLQGDVGSGKTVVAASSLYANYLRGDQGAFLAPTDALARQHYKTLTNLFKSFPLKIELLVGSLLEKEKKEIKERLIAGKIDILVGTHALFSADVFYQSLGLVIIDEQHRFGVNQRAALAAKGDRSDLLLISATPIPRTLALSIYGDLDVTTLDQFPNKERQITTKIVESSDKELKEVVEEALNKEEQIFIIAPRIEDVENKNLAAETLYKTYNKAYPNRVSLLHGKLKQEEKETAFDAFKAGLTPILVATSVIEVGIDVPSASLMIIYAPTHFGLASLHQLRGRIGRLGQPSLCLLVGDDLDDISLEKLNVLVKSNDGFYIAEKDLELRGPGEIASVNQSGLPSFRYVNLISDFEMFKYAKADAEAILKNSDKKDNEVIIEHAKYLLQTKGFLNA